MKGILKRVNIKMRVIEKPLDVLIGSCLKRGRVNKLEKVRGFRGLPHKGPQSDTGTWEVPL